MGNHNKIRKGGAGVEMKGYARNESGTAILMLITSLLLVLAR